MPETAPPEAVEEIKEPLEEEESSEAAPQKAKSGGLLQTIIIVVASQIIMAVGAFFFVKLYLVPLLSNETAKIEEQVIEIEREPAEWFMIEDLVVNPAGTKGKRYLSASIGFDYAKAILSEEDQEESSGGGGHGSATESSGGSDKRTRVVRDLLIKILTAKTIEQLSSIEGKDSLRTEIMSTLNHEMAPDTIYKVYFVDYLLQ